MSTATLSRPSIVTLHERQTVSGRVDRAAGVIRGVKIIGRISANGREYTREALSKARGLYEGIKVNCDHPTRHNEARGVGDRFGRLVNVREKDGSLYGDLEYLKSHPMAERVAEAAETMPDAFGLSHNAEGRTVMRNGKTIVEEITRVRSVDLVSDPATTSGLFESRGRRDADAAVLRFNAKCTQILREAGINPFGDVPAEDEDDGKPAMTVSAEQGASDVVAPFDCEILHVVEDSSSPLK
jgi:hypothetical protein